MIDRGPRTTPLLPLPLLLLLLSPPLLCALAGPGAAQAQVPHDRSPDDLVTLPIPGELRVCADSGVTSAQEWSQRAAVILREVREDCESRVSESDEAVCVVAAYDLLQFVKSRGDD